MCPEDARAINYPGQEVVCGSCLASRAEMFAFGVNMLANTDTMLDIQDCASSGRCEGWKLCTEAERGTLSSEDWITSYIGWGIAPERRLFRGDGEHGPDEPRLCRPHDAALWIEAATIFARLSEHREFASSPRTQGVSRDYHALSTRLDSECNLQGVEAGGQWWIPATVALNNNGLFCMPKDRDSHLRTSNICSTTKLDRCYVSRAVLAVISARMRGDIALADCAPIDINEVQCSGHRN